MKPAATLWKWVFGKRSNNGRNTNSENPYKERVEVWKKVGNEYVPVRKRNGDIEYTTRERRIPKGLSDNDKNILKKVRKRAYRYDMGWGCCCGIRWGISSLVGLIPVAGDCIDLAMAWWLIRTASKVDGGLPKRVYATMFGNVVLDFVLGFVPFIGDIADTLFRANTRNAWLLHDYLTEKVGGKDLENGAAIRIPNELHVAPGDRHVEEGIEPEKRVGPTPVAPVFVTPGRAPAAARNMPPSSQPGMTGRSLTGSKTPGRPVQDPRDYNRR